MEWGIRMKEAVQRGAPAVHVQVSLNPWLKAMLAVCRARLLKVYQIA